jgi:Fe-S cluster biosynthesis and repair protein YggX
MTISAMVSTRETEGREHRALWAELQEALWEELQKALWEELRDTQR